ncbi:MAG: ABC transporter permease [Oscillospiraceae bacterium]|nr:ABC transporter permease [Oscillospiraceae bacterium]
MGKRLFYPRLAAANLRKNHSVYRPYILAVVLLSAMYYCLHSISAMVGSSGAGGSWQMAALLSMSAWLIGFFSLLVLFYANSFVIKRRAREFGLYSILGMEKRHICRVMVWEVLLVGAGGVLAGMALGALFSQAFLLVLQRLAAVAVQLTFRIPLGAVGSTAALFAGVFALVLVYDVIAVLRSRPIELLRSARQGEREPKARWLLALAGLAALGGGYCMALRVDRPGDALLAFFPAVFLVIVGTYCLFIAGSVSILKLLRKNKGFYYRPRNFISVSTLLYRMKQNAAGLASICILSTCVLVTVSSTLSLFLGEEDSLRRMYPRMVNVECVLEEEGSLDAVADAAWGYTAACGGEIQDLATYRVLQCPASALGGGVYETTDYYGTDSIEILALPLSDYNLCAGTSLTLSPEEVLVCAGSWPDVAAVQLDGWVYGVAGVLEEAPDFLAGVIGDRLVLVVADGEALTQLRDRSAMTAGLQRDIQGCCLFDIRGIADPEAYYAGIARELTDNHPVQAVRCRDLDRGEFYEIYGTLLFVGVFFAALFVIAVVLIIYYKQVTEGFDDHDRFRILRNVGMSDREIRKVISKQVLLVFYLPLAAAMVHIAVAFPVLCRILQAFQLYNTRLFLLCTAGTAGLFVAFYFLTYRLTARTYYRIVHV